MNKKRVHEIDSIVEEKRKPNENIKPPKFDVVTEGYNPIIEELDLPDIITATEQHDIDVDRKPSNKTYIEKPIRSNKEDFRSYAKRLDRYIIHLQNLLNKNK